MEKEQIIKALECFHNRILNSKLAEKVTEQERMAIIDALIKELTEKVEAYRQELGKVRVALNNANVDNKRLTEENERLKQLNESYAEVEQGYIVTGVKKVQADTVQKFAERFYELMGNEYTSCGFCNAMGYWSVKAVKDNIDRIANEILNGKEEKNGLQKH